jgi:hypothetical protein
MLDFGMSYIQAKQAADDVIAEKNGDRGQRVMQDVNAYWRAVSAGEFSVSEAG